MRLFLKLHRFLDKLLTLLPGKASDPASLEAHVRRGIKASEHQYSKAIDLMDEADEYTQTIEQDVKAKARKAIAAVEQGISGLQDRAKKLRELIYLREEWTSFTPHLSDDPRRPKCRKNPVLSAQPFMS